MRCGVSSLPAIASAGTNFTAFAVIIDSWTDQICNNNESDAEKKLMSLNIAYEVIRGRLDVNNPRESKFLQNLMNNVKSPSRKYRWGRSTR